MFKIGDEVIIKEGAFTGEIHRIKSVRYLLDDRGYFPSDKLKLFEREIGNKPTDWTPTPEDIQDGTLLAISTKKDKEINPLDTEIGGNHYKDMPIQPVEYIQKNHLGFLEGNVIKYISRYKNKNGKEDLLKAKHYIDLLIKYEYENK